MDHKRIIESYFKPHPKRADFSLICEIINEELTILKEGRGMVAREVGQEFVNKETEETRLFAGFMLFPSNGPRYASFDELEEDLKEALGIEKDGFIEEGDVGTSGRGQILIERIVGQRNAGTRAAMVIGLNDKDNARTYGYIKYMGSMSSGGLGKWTETQFRKDTGFMRAASTAVKENIPMQPSDLVKDFNARTVPELHKVVIANAKRLVGTGALTNDNVVHIDQCFKAAMAGAEAPILEGAAELRSTYEKYLGEILAPVSAVTGWLSVGQRDEAEAALIKTKNPRASWSDFKIRFPMSVTNMLTDSELIIGNPSDPEIAVGISSKAGPGAAASISSLWRTVQEGDFPDEFRKRYKSVLDFIEVVMTNSSIEAPLILAERQGLINAQDAQGLIEAFKNQAQRLEANDWIKAIKTGKVYKPSARVLKLSAVLGGTTPFDRAKMDNPPGYRPMWHILAGIAKALALKASKDPLFNEGARAILEKTPMIQTYAKTGKKGDAIAFASFTIKYPPQFDGRIVVDAAKNYFATDRPKGRLGFKLKK